MGEGRADVAAVTDELADELLVDRYLPRFDVTLIEHAVADADLARTWEALRRFDLLDVHSPLTDAAMSVRRLPAALAAHLGRRPPPEPPPRLTLGGGLALEGWLSLGERDGQEIAFGAVGRFWQPDIRWYDVSSMTPDGFAAFDEPGWGRIAASFSLRPYGRHRTLISYEARTATGDPRSRRRFARYWVLVRPFVRSILRATVDTLKRDAEAH
ncbi:hypothetical protein [Pseudonocardia sp.]|uniref:hypothetical protein n=1 Tax=Pseudonocardia sp. TaxID=60912 RepID=UPI003D0A5E25